MKRVSPVRRFAKF